VKLGIPRTLLTAVVTAVCSGTVVGTLMVLGSGGAVPPLVVALGLGAAGSMFASVPLGLLGGGVVAWTLARERQVRTRSEWLSIGSAAGSVVGAVGSAAYSAVLNGLDYTGALIFFIAGGVAGLIAGLILGLWCARQTSVKT
jgi:hypothetical protein